MGRREKLYDSTTKDLSPAQPGIWSNSSGTRLPALAAYAGGVALTFVKCSKNVRVFLLILGKRSEGLRNAAFPEA
ncbi:MAG: hypothetical protein HQL44_09140 [Alphaproteobacteria bacterium]|nr:hypothetical protein [Alphaproteobacteria bacterium]